MKTMQAGILTYRQSQNVFPGNTSIKHLTLSINKPSDLLFASLRSAHSSGTVRDSHPVPFFNSSREYLHCTCKGINNSHKEEIFGLFYAFRCCIHGKIENKTGGFANQNSLNWLAKPPILLTKTSFLIWQQYTIGTI